MAHAHETQAKISLLKKSPAAYAKGFCATVRKFFATCQENIYSLSRKYLQPIHKIFTVCRKDFHCTVGNILRVQSETFCVYSRKHSACTVRKIPAVLAGKSPQYTRKKICKYAKKCYFGMKFTQIARISRFAVVCALLFCVCGAMSAWGETFYWNPAKNKKNENYDWKGDGNWLVYDSVDKTYKIASSYPGKGDVATDSVVFGWTGATEILSDSTINVTIDGKVTVSGFAMYFTKDYEKIYINFSPKNEKNKPTLSFSRFLMGINSGTDVSDINVSFGVNINSTGTVKNVQNVNVEIASGCTFANSGPSSGVTVEANSTFTVNGTLNATSITNNGTINVGNGTLASNGTWSNKGTVTVANGNVTFANPATDEGTWNYNNTTDRNLISNITYKNLNLNDRTITAVANVQATYTITIGSSAVFDLSNRDVTATTIANNGTVRLHGTQTVTTATINNNTNSTVEFYGTGDINNISKMGTIFHHLRVTATNERTATFNDTTTVNGSMTLTGTNTNHLTINGTNSANIIIGANSGSGTWLNIDYNTVSINGGSESTYDVRTNCFDSGGNYVYDNQRGWLFQPSSKIYYWVGSNGNWSVVGNWRYATGYPAGETPGTRENAEVHITNGSTVTQDVDSMTYTLSSLEITNGTLNLDENLTVANTINVVGTTATLALGEKTLSVNGTWSNNNGTVTVTSGNATFARAATDNGTWTYNNTTDRNLIPSITYNILNLSGTGTITPTAAVTANNININANTTLALGVNSLTSRNNLVNAGTINLAAGSMAIQGTWTNNGNITVTSGNATFARGATDSGTWTYNNSGNRNLISNITYNILNLNGTGTIAPVATVIANNININNGTILALGANNLTVRNLWTNNGIVTVTSGNATLPNGATDSGTWTYTTSRDGIVSNITYKDLNIGNATPADITVSVRTPINATGIITNNGTLNLGAYGITANTITNNGTVRLYGTQNVGGTVANEPNSTVEYYGDTYATPININRFGSTYGNFIMRGYNKTLNVNESIAVNGDLVLQGKDVDNMLTVTRTASGTATITVNKPQASSVTANPPAGNFIAMQRRNISITGTKIGDYKGSPYYYYAENSYDLDDYNVDVLRNGWRFKPVISLENISFTLTSIGSNRFYFRTTPANMAELGNVPTKLFDMLLHRYFAVVTPKSPLAPNATLKIDAATAPQRITNGSNLAWIGLSLTNNISLQDLQNFYIRADKQTEVNQYSFHALSDFAIDVVAPRYAFDNRHLDSGNAEEAAGGVAIRNWDRDQESNGQLVTKSDITISAGLNVDGLGVPVVYFDASPDAASVSTSYNSDAGGAWRIWLPKAFKGLAPVANSEYITFEEGASVGGNSLRFDLQVTKGEKFSSWKAGDQISFLFELKDANGKGMTVCHEPVLNDAVLNVSATAPLYALRLQVPEDITTLDLWSFKLRDIKSQRGNITIMNNVINVLSGENMILDVNVPVPGVLNIMVMTLDGTIVKYLQHGSVSQGKHVYHWDGRNNSGKPVARGLYFIRIVGCTIDESRKVMAVWQ